MLCRVSRVSRVRRVPERKVLAPLGITDGLMEIINPWHGTYTHTRPSDPTCSLQSRESHRPDCQSRLGGRGDRPRGRGVGARCQDDLGREEDQARGNGRCCCDVGMARTLTHALPILLVPSNHGNLTDLR
jgi:hypothetical protein